MEDNPRTARLKHLKFYQKLSQEYQCKLRTLSSRKNRPGLSKIAIACYDALIEICEIELNSCKQEIRNMLNIKNLL